jgi:hypothetical protein
MSARDWAKQNPNEKLVSPDSFFSDICTYSEHAASILQLTPEEAAARVREDYKFKLDDIIVRLKGIRVAPHAAVYAKFGRDEDEGELSPHHGWFFDFFACVAGREVDILKAIRFDRTMQGLVSASFVIVVLPTIGAYWHGLYERGYELIRSSSMLNDILFDGDFDFKLNSPEVKNAVNTDLGLRTRGLENGVTCSCLCYSECEGIFDYQFALDENGYCVRKEKKSLLKTSGTVLY